MSEIVQICELDSKEANKCCTILVIDPNPETIVMPWIVRGGETITAVFTALSHKQKWNIPKELCFHTLEKLPAIIKRQKALLELCNKLSVPQFTIIIDTTKDDEIDPEKVMEKDLIQELWTNARNFKMRLIVTMSQPLILTPKFRATCDAILFRGSFLFKNISKPTVLRFLETYDFPSTMNVPADDCYKVLIESHDNQQHSKNDTIWCYLCSCGVRFLRVSQSDALKIHYYQIYMERFCRNILGSR